jgi:hypothetical protein
MFIKAVFVLIFLVFVNAPAFLISQIPPLYDSVLMLILSASVVAIPAALMLKSAVFNPHYEN